MENALVRDADNMGVNEAATLLVKLYSEYKHLTGNDNDDFAIAVAIAIRMLSD